MNDEENIDTTLKESLIQHIRDEDPFLYNSLPEIMQKDLRIAFAAILGGESRITNNNTRRSGHDAATPFLVDDDNNNGNGRIFCNKTYQNYRSLITNLCKYQPEAIGGTKWGFRIVVLAICNVDNRFSSTLLPYLDKVGSHDDTHRLKVLTSIWDTFPSGLLKEEHYIMVTIPNFFISLWWWPRLRLENIPERFIRCRALFSHLTKSCKNLFSMPKELVEDKEFCLALMRIAKIYTLDDDTFITDGIWISFPEKVRRDVHFYSQAVLRNIHVLHYHWTLSLSCEAPLKVFLSAIKGHGYRKTVICRQISDPMNLIKIFDRKMKSELDHFDEFTVFVGGIVQSRRGGENCRCSYLRQIDFGDKETSIGIKKHIASYVGVPTGQYLADLREVSILSRQFQDLE